MSRRGVFGCRDALDFENFRNRKILVPAAGLAQHDADPLTWSQAVLLDEIGGEVKVKGHNARNLPWSIAIESPITDGRAVQKIINPDIMGVATSGDYRNYFEKDGKRWALLRAPDGTLHRTTAGRYMGHNHGKILKISESQLELKEIVPDGLGGWVERFSTLTVNE